MLKWLKSFFIKDEDTRVLDDFVGFMILPVNSVSNRSIYFKPKRTKIAGKRPIDLVEHEMCYNIADDEFYIGLGDNKYKVYRCASD